MGNRVASELVSSLRLSTLGTTLSSRTDARPPAMVDINSFPGVAKAFVRFRGDEGYPVNGSAQINRSFNISSVKYIGRGQYEVVFNEEFLKYNLGLQYIVSGSVQSHMDNLTAANSFYIMQGPIGGNTWTTLSSFRIITVNTGMPTITATNARVVNLTIF
jgi:hypothetical protein